MRTATVGRRVCAVTATVGRRVCAVTATVGRRVCAVTAAVGWRVCAVTATVGWRFCAVTAAVGWRVCAVTAAVGWRFCAVTVAVGRRVRRGDGMLSQENKQPNGQNSADDAVCKNTQHAVIGTPNSYHPIRSLLNNLYSYEVAAEQQLSGHKINHFNTSKQLGLSSDRSAYGQNVRSVHYFF